MMTIHPAATFTYVDFMLRYAASFLYFCDNIERFCAFVSNSEKYKRIIIKITNIQVMHKIINL